ncbi:AraC family transcriptional regulator [Pseudomonas sp. TTU2014-080ASC]|uniref:AraC family transcriptional regulator n=1 Tax=Pseudomonas sp. TTU2014-080ASC TaxID=1729724 RepID=UPI0007186EE8|nr:AraC family transcriptional regulator [Pseudomonas sp. TTU2014-080ASC]KRW59620.1 AraC family transcriptional regulator [Pseudomonas sp. TTU2014-080ASC]
MESRLLSVRSRVFERADPYEVSEYVNQHVGAHDIRLPRSGYPQASLSHRPFSSLDLCRISYGGVVRVTSPALESIFHLQILLRGQCLWRTRNQEHRLTPGDAVLINPDDPVDLTYSEDCEKFILKLPVSLLDSICEAQHWQRPEEGIRFLNQRYGSAELSSFYSLLDVVCHEAEEASLDRVQQHFAHIIGSKLLVLMQNNVSREQLNSQVARFEQIADFIEANLKLELSAEHLAQQANMSVRSLYGLFERQVGLTPLNYIRQKRLERIRACLLDPDCGVRNVTELALEYGFLHLGRFSQIYRQQFAELPSETFKRRG